MGDPVSGIGAIFNRKNPSTGVWEPLAKIRNINGPSKTRNTIDVTTLESTDGYQEFIGGLRDGGEISFSMIFTSDSYAIINADYESDVLRDYQIVLPTTENNTFEFSGLVTAAPINVQVDDVIQSDCTIKVSGPVDDSTVDLIASVAAISDINVANDTQLADVGLSTTVSVTYDDGTVTTCAVTWDAGTPIYDGGTAGTYAFVGTLNPATGVLNPEGYAAAVNVIVAS